MTLATGSWRFGIICRMKVEPNKEIPIDPGVRRESNRGWIGIPLWFACLLDIKMDRLFAAQLRNVQGGMILGMALGTAGGDAPTCIHTGGNLRPG